MIGCGLCVHGCSCGVITLCWVVKNRPEPVRLLWGLFTACRKPVGLTVLMQSEISLDAVICPALQQNALILFQRFVALPGRMQSGCHQCTNLDCSCTFKTNESITKILTAPPQQEKVPDAPPEPIRERQTLGRYGSSFRQVY